MKKITNQPLKGFYDWEPEEYAKRNYIFQAFEKICENYGYQRYLTPTFENADIYRAKSGEDVGGKELMICIDRAGRELAVRPEMTPSVTRLVTKTYKSDVKPIKLYSIANFVRNQKPQRGRNREFWQLNYDIFGSESLNADIETIKIALDIMLEFNPPADSFTLYINNRKLIDKVLDDIAKLDQDSKTEVVRILDKKNKLSKEEFVGRFEKAGLKKDQIEKIYKFSESNTAEELVKNIPEIKENEGYIETVKIVERLEELGYRDWIEFNPAIIRGFDYYDGMVFEVFDNHPKNNRSLFGGGRYNGLAGIFGEETFPAVGCAPGDETLKLFLEEWDLFPEFNIEPETLVTVFNEDLRSDSMNLADEFRKAGIDTEIYLEEDGLGDQIGYADKKGIRYVIIVGPDEKEKGLVTLKDLESGSEITKNLSEIIQNITKMK